MEVGFDGKGNFSAYFWLCQIINVKIPEENW